MISNEVISALESLHKELDKLKPAITNVEVAIEVTKSLQEAIEKLSVFLEEVKKNDLKFKADLVKQLEKVIRELSEETKNLQDETKVIQAEVRDEITQIKTLCEIIKKFHDKVEQINFPERLDKLDANIAGLLAALHAVQSRIETLERNISDKIRDIIESQKETSSKIISEVQSAKQKSQSNSVITWVLISISTIAIIIVLLSK